jgi:hypothetical protein
LSLEIGFINVSILWRWSFFFHVTQAAGTGALFNSDTRILALALTVTGPSLKYGA